MSGAHWRPKKIIAVKFYRASNRKEPVRVWLKSLTGEQKKIIGEDIKTVEFGWPIGMPLVRYMEAKLWEIRSNFSDGIARIFFTVYEQQLILLHGFIKKTQKTPEKELEIARRRLKDMEV